jgi:hypothetical protein
MKLAKRSLGPALLAVCLAAIGTAHAMTLSSDSGNFVELMQQSNDIVVGKVTSVTDGIGDRGIPYTEVTLEVSETIRGAVSGVYTFRQFGLLTPRLTADGRRKMMPAPEGFPIYKTGEHLVLFLRPAAAWTGFRMPAGVTSGKFNVGPGRVANEGGNAGLFRDVHLDNGLATSAEKRMMDTGGPANPDTFLSFVRRAVHERWIETGRMKRASSRVIAPEPPPSDVVNGQDQPSGAKPPATEPTIQPQDPNANNAIAGAGKGARR